MKRKLMAASLMLATLAPAFPAHAEGTPQAKPLIETVSQLLAQGYQIHSITIIDQAVARRMSGSDSWQDDLMLTLTKGADFAFCHFALSVVMSGVGLKNGQCNVAQ